LCSRLSCLLSKFFLFFYSWANLTSNLDRIKIVFTPMLCRRVCSGGRCHNSCEKGDTTTVYSESQQQQQQPKNQGFRLFFCQIPCLNGGRCIGRDLCWCPSNSTGKFCHLPVPTPARPATHSRKDSSQPGPNSHSMYTLPLSNQQGNHQFSLHPSLVNVHIQHPPEAEVQVHQVARVRPGQRPTTTEGAHSVQQRSQKHASVGVPPPPQNHTHTFPHTYTNSLTKQDDCCGSVGASWGLNKCQKCPTKPAYAVIANGQVECPKGYKRMNLTHCQDINECLMPGLCKNAECLNTKGSYRCTCKPGYMLDAARSHCVSDKAVSDQREMCYRSVSAGTCSLPLSQHITKQICCCSRVGKAWGTGCERCPLPESGTDTSPVLPAAAPLTAAAHWATISQLPTGPAGTPVPPVPRDATSTPVPPVPRDATSTPVPPVPRDATRTPVPPYPTAAALSLPQLHTPNIDKCAITPTICGHGKCIPVQTGYTCYCEPGYKLSALQTNCIDVNECEEDPCEGKGQCVNTFGSYTCQCYSGYSQVITQKRKFCQDINECSMPNKCQDGECVNTEGSYTCECKSGYAKSWRGLCEDVDECRDPSSCHGVCVNTPGSFHCQACGLGFRSANGRCVDVNECAAGNMCPAGICINTEGSYTCQNCRPGFGPSADGLRCDDLDECAQGDLCLGGVCTNTEGSYMCTSCQPGYTVSQDQQSCEGKLAQHIWAACQVKMVMMKLFCFAHMLNIDECQSLSTCVNGICLNSEGSYTCNTCPTGYKVSYNGEICQDIDECNPGVCPMGVCTNTEGSFSCMTCDPGFTVAPNGLSCEDIDECVNETICGNHGFCENTDGSFRCQCDQGYTNPPGDLSRCVDINECEMSLALCGEALCENFDGSFLCICTSDNEEFDPLTSQCRSLGNTDVDVQERKECYYNLNDANFCDNVLSRNTTKQECCCTVGTGWGDNCEIHVCPVVGQGTTLCPHGGGLLPQIVSSSAQNVNECEMFGPDICKNGQCFNLFSTYTCYCRSGFYYDNIRLECVDYDECEMENVCLDGVCVNTAGSFNCFCSPPLVLDGSRRRCINTTEGMKDAIFTTIYCTELVENNMCADPLPGRRTTYTECCCLYGLAWGEQCALCPRRESEDYAVMCNLPRRGGSDSLRERPGYEYSPEECRLIYFFPCSDRYDSFEGLRAEECGILNGCENGRCVRVREGYTCDCFDGFELDLNKMACIDINECEDISDKVALCQNGQCTNTEGSYKCTCLPGFVASAKPHECIPGLALNLQQ
uniref:Latent-transforming growth factor beta-binding protein 2 n=1 Tax=Myripristis murdjan TaxID=586833 RepID=A0A667YB70_9TELE